MLWLLELYFGTDIFYHPEGTANPSRTGTFGWTRRPKNIEELIDSGFYLLLSFKALSSAYSDFLILQNAGFSRCH